MWNRLRERVSQPTAVAVVYVAAIFMSTMDTTIVNVALPSIGRSFGVATTAVDAVSIGYLVSLAVFVPASGWLGDRFGGKRTLLSAVAVFSIASLLCGTATNLGQLVAYRVLQGAGGGMLASVGMAMLVHAYPPRARLRVSALLSVAIGLAPTVGPILGGLLVTAESWRSVFTVNVPIGVAALIFGALFLRTDTDRHAVSFDAGGFLLAAGGLGSAMFAVCAGPNFGWASATVVGTGITGVVLLAVLIGFELRRKAPIIDLRLLTRRLFRAGSLVILAESTAFLGALYTVTLYFQDGRGLSALAAGLNIFPEALGVMVGSSLAGRLLYPVLGPRRHLLAGVAGSSISIALLGTVGITTDLWLVRILLFAMGFAVGQVFVATQTVAFAEISPDISGPASTLFNIGRRLGSALGVAACTWAILAIGTAGSGAGGTVSAYRAAFLVAAAINLLGLWSAWTVRPGDAANTLTRRSRKTSGALPIGTESVPRERI